MNEGVYLTPTELCERYRGTINIRTLANWRANGQGPAFRKIGGKVLYTLEAVVTWEEKRTRGNK